jgi:hypothetical protein
MELAVLLIVMHLVATVLAFALLALLFHAGAEVVHGRRPGNFIGLVAFSPSLLPGLVFRRHLSARPTPGFTTKVAFAFTATNLACAGTAAWLWPHLLPPLPHLYPYQWWGVVLAFIGLSWMSSAIAFHVATRLSFQEQMIGRVH